MKRQMETSFPRVCHSDIYQVGHESCIVFSSQHHQSRDPAYATCTPGFPTEYRKVKPCLTFPSKTFIKCSGTRFVPQDICVKNNTDLIYLGVSILSHQNGQ